MDDEYRKGYRIEIDSYGAFFKRVKIFENTCFEIIFAYINYCSTPATAVFI